MALAKIRALHPDIFSDDDLCEVSIPARWLFAGLWCYACDNGHLEDRPKQIKRWIFASDDVSAADLLRELENVAGVIARPFAGWIVVPALPRRQKVDWRYFKTCDYPGGCEKPARKADSQRETRRGPAVDPAGTRRDHATDGDGVRDGDGDGDGDRSGLPSVAPANAAKPTTTAADAAKPKGKRATQRPAEFRPGQQHIDIAAELGVDLRAEWAKFCDWCDSVGKTYKDWDAALRGWIRRARPTVTTGRSNVQAHMDLARDLAAREGADPWGGEQR